MARIACLQVHSRPALGPQKIPALELCCSVPESQSGVRVKTNDIHCLNIHQIGAKYATDWQRAGKYVILKAGVNNLDLS